MHILIMLVAAMLTNTLPSPDALTSQIASADAMVFDAYNRGDLDKLHKSQLHRLEIFRTVNPRHFLEFVSFHGLITE